MKAPLTGFDRVIRPSPSELLELLEPRFNMDILSIDPGHVNLGVVRIRKERDGTLWYGGGETHKVCGSCIPGGNGAIIRYLLEWLQNNGPDLCNPMPTTVLIERQGMLNYGGPRVYHRTASVLNLLVANTIANYFVSAGIEVKMVSPATHSKCVLDCSNAKMKKTRVRHFCKTVVRPALVNGGNVKKEFKYQHECDALVQAYLFLGD
jgi:hypothetical protein